MFCEKCGNPVSDNDKFCQRCGAPVTPLTNTPQPEVQPQQQNEPVQPEPQYQTIQPEQVNEPVQPEPQYQTIQPEQPYQEVQPEQPYQEVQPEQPYQPYQPVQSEQGQQFDPAVNTAPDQPAPKTSMPKGLKLGLIFGGAGVALVAVILVVIFVVILPMFKTKIDLSKFVRTEFYDNSGSVVDGNISGEFELDAQKIAEAYPGLFGGNTVDSYSKVFELGSTLYDIKVEYVNSPEPTENDYAYKQVAFSGLSKDDEAKIRIIIPEKGDYTYEDLKKQESRFGVEFTGGECTVSIAEELEKNGINIIETEEVDLLGYLEKNNLVTAIINYKDEVSVGIKPFETKFGDFTVKNENYDANSVSVYDARDNYVTSIYLDFGDAKNLKAGSKVTVKYEDDGSYLAEYYGLKPVGKEFTYTVVMPVKLDAESAKKNVSAIKDYIAAHPELDSSFKDGDKVEVGDIYYVTWKDNAGYQDIVAVIHNTTQNYYCTLEIDAKGFFSGNEFIYGGYSAYAGTHEKSAADAVKNNAYLQSDSKYYNATKLN